MLPLVVAGFIVLMLSVWVIDAFRPQTVVTIYTVDCKSGAWEGTHCYGRLVPGPRYRFEVVVASGEVRFTNVDDPEIHGAYSHGAIAGPTKWSCEVDALSSTTITHRMESGRPVVDPAAHTIPFHEIGQWRWFLLRMGFPVGHGES